MHFCSHGGQSSKASEDFGMNPEQMITIQKMAELCALSPRYIRVLIEEGKIKAYQFGKSKGKRIKWKDAKDFIESRKI
jgi:excisionase family DNA binding protein